METDARCGVEVSRPDCFFSRVIVAASLPTFGWIFGEFMLTPVHCSSPVCERWTRRLHLSVVSSFAGLGRLVLAAMNIPPGTILPLGAGLLGLTALAGLLNPGMFVLTAVAFLLAAGVVVWFAVGWLD